MTRIVICGGPRTGKTTLALEMLRHTPVCEDKAHARCICTALNHSDDLIAELAHLGKDAWSEGSRRVTEWLDAPGPWIIEGVALARALRKWREAHPGEPPPVDRVIRLTTPRVPLSHQQTIMAKGEETVWNEVGPWLFHSGVSIEHHGHDPGSDRHRVPHPTRIA